MNASDPFVRQDGTHLASTQQFLGFASTNTTPTYIPYGSPLLTAEERNVRCVTSVVTLHRTCGAWNVRILFSNCLEAQKWLCVRSAY
jgi:hypothetical protein